MQHPEPERSASASAEQQTRLLMMLTLLRDAGADDLAARITEDAALLLYDEVVRAVERAAAEWRATQAAVA